MNNIHLKQLIQFLSEDIKTSGIPNNIRFNNAKEMMYLLDSDYDI